MGFLTNWIVDFIKGLLIEGIMGNLSGLFDTVNNRVGEIATTVGTPPAQWQPGVFALIRNLSETVVLPIAGIVITFLATYELINLIIDKNNLNEVDTWIFFKWIFKTFIAVLILSNTFDIVMAVFDVSQSVINNAGGLIAGSTEVTLDMMAEFEASLWDMGTGYLLGLWFQTLFVGITMRALNIVIFIIVYGRMIEIFLMTSLA
ncbi:MAG: CD0415/CD1112 family protein, partial [Firmicutes bacterium]|nr:CD0415/CD1112 family protein [Bacillota bacterium]